MNPINYSKLSAPSAHALFALEASLKESSIDKGLLNLIKLRASQINGCAFCVDMHVKEALLHGERPLRLYHLTVWKESPHFSEKEKAALHWTELVTKVSEGVPEEELEKLLKVFSEKEVSDLTFAITTINAWNRLGIAFHSVPGSMDKMLGLDKAGLN